MDYSILSETHKELDDSDDVHKAEKRMQKHINDLMNTIQRIQVSYYTLFTHYSFIFGSFFIHCFTHFFTYFFSNNFSLIFGSFLLIYSLLLLVFPYSLLYFIPPSSFPFFLLLLLGQSEIIIIIYCCIPLLPYSFPSFPSFSSHSFLPSFLRPKT